MKNTAQGEAIDNIPTWIWNWSCARISFCINSKSYPSFVPLKRKPYGLWSSQVIFFLFIKFIKALQHKCINDYKCCTSVVYRLFKWFCGLCAGSGFLMLILWSVILVNATLANALVEVKFYYYILLHYNMCYYPCFEWIWHVVSATCHAMIFHALGFCQCTHLVPVSPRALKLGVI